MRRALELGGVHVGSDKAKQIKRLTLVALALRQSKNILSIPALNMQSCP